MSQNTFDINNRNVVITGGSTGIGFALAKALGAKGCKLLVAEPDEERLKTAVSALNDLGIDANYHVCDVSELSQVQQLADTAWELFGRVDMVFNNAGIGIRQKPIIETSPTELQAVFDVNFFGVWHGSKIFAERLIEQGTPAGIYNTGSENSLFNAVPNNAAYLASKHAVLGMTENLREQMPDFIRVGLIIPGLVESELTKRIAHLAMDADTFAVCVLKQIADGQFYIVSHAYNMVQINKRYEEIAAAYAQYAPRYEGDEEYDIRHLFSKA